jgi:hypothetical protein
MGGSPDALIAEDGLLEIKCPKTKTHIEWFLADAVPPEHEPQMSFYLAVTGREWADFASFDPRLPEPLQLFKKRLWRNPERITEIEEAVKQFNFEVDKVIERLQEIAGPFTLPQAQTQMQTGLPAALEAELQLMDEDIRRADPAWKG